MKKEAVKKFIQVKADAGSMDLYNSQEMTRMENMLASLCDAGPSMRKDLRRIVSSGGKRLRPILALLCYRLESGGNNAKDIVPLMYMLELMHTSSLIHDDVVDSARLRRNCPTINSTSGDFAAVQSGDFLLAKAMEKLGIYRGMGINEELAEVSAQMCLGELEQLRIRFKTQEQNRALYFLQIQRKTASLIAASCYTGALAVGMNESKALALKFYGECLGIAFQLRDDLLDFDETGISGKAPGQDLKNGVYTLPFLFLLREGVPDQIRCLLEKKEKNKRQVQALLDYIKNTNALSEAEILIGYIVNEAVAALSEFPDCAEKHALTELANALMERPILHASVDAC
jgi:heptaprenyl diphosphate synthase